MSSTEQTSIEEARSIGETIGIDFKSVSIDEFRIGIDVEMEHGSHDPQTNVIGNDKHLAGKIAWAHLKELPDYYTRLAQMEDGAETDK